MSKRKKALRQKEQLQRPDEPLSAAASADMSSIPLERLPDHVTT